MDCSGFSMFYGIPFMRMKNYGLAALVFGTGLSLLRESGLQGGCGTTEVVFFVRSWGLRASCVQVYCGEETKYYAKFQSFLVLLLSDTVKWAGRILDTV